MLATALLLLTHQRRFADNSGIRRLRWIWLGTWGALIIFVPTAGIAFPVLSGTKYMYLALLGASMAPVWMIGCVMVAVFFSESLDPRLAFRKATLYSILTALMTSLFIVIEGLLQGYVFFNVHFPDITAVAVGASIVAVAFSPIRSFTDGWVKRLVERVMPVAVFAAGHREFTTVVFVDLSGYTNLTDKDEASALVLAAGFHREMTKAAARRNGRVVKKIGDALLLVFHSGDDALLAIRDGSIAFSKFATTLELPGLQIHAGINAGEVVVMPDGDVMGATVNIAARLMAAAGKGEIVVSIPEAKRASVEPAKLEKVQCKGITEAVACRRLAITETDK